jgi:amino-acid N-acetyltransferase
MKHQNWSQVDLIREAFHYQSRFSGTTMVFKVDFPLTEDAGFSFLMKDIALLSQIGIRVVIVPGAKEWIDSVLDEYNIKTAYSGSLRITSAEAMPFVNMAAFNVATKFITGLSASRVNAVIGSFVKARGLGIVDGIDMAHTGMMDKILTDTIEPILERGMIPILPCIGWSSSGKPYNIPSDEIALEVSKALHAVKLFIVSAAKDIAAPEYIIPESIHTDEQGRLVRLTPHETEAILKVNQFEAKLHDAALAELQLALNASKAGIERVHIIDGKQDGAILRELFSNLGVGTMVYADEYESIRPLNLEDIPDVLRLMEPLMKQGILLRRTHEDIQEKKDDYLVFEIDGSVHACAAMHDWGEDQAEIAAIATDPTYSDLGMGRRLVRYLIDKARKQGFRKVFVLTTKTHDWFELMGFAESTIENLPSRKRACYDTSRKSKIFSLDL